MTIGLLGVEVSQRCVVLLPSCCGVTLLCGVVLLIGGEVMPLCRVILSSREVSTMRDALTSLFDVVLS